MSNFVPSSKQLDIFTTWEAEDCNILINAVAGSGKTTTLLNLLERCQYRTLFLAFNKSVQEEIQHKIDGRGLRQGRSMTMHSMGLMAIRAAYRTFKLNSGKNFDILKRVQEEFSMMFRRMPWKDKVRFGYTLMDMNDVSRLYLTNDLEEIFNQFITMDKPIFQHDRLAEVWNRFVQIRDSYYEGTNVEIDFTDMIYLPVRKRLNIPLDPTYLMIDEAQDLNLCQHLLIDMLLAQGTVKKWIAVGDRNQAIYGFSGAHTSSFDMFLEKGGEVKELPLDICYRCPINVIDAANEVYPVMEYSREEEGVVETIQNAELIKNNSMVICRNSSPLIDLYFRLLGQGKEAYIKGEDILQSLLRFMKPYNRSRIGEARMEMIQKLEELNQDKTDNGRLRYFVFKENFENFGKLSQHLCESWQTVNTLEAKVKSLFIDKENAIMLCTIHKAKGLEADVVYILNEFLIPSKFAKSPEQLKQENNLKYVARTRARKELYFLDL